MGITDLFSGKAGRKAVVAQINALQQAQNAATGAIDAGVTAGMPFLTGPGGATDALRGGYGNALAALERFYGPAQGFAGEATAAFSPMMTTGRQGVDAYAAALGLGGASPTDAFRNTPGYEFARDEGLEAIKRAAASRGDLASGNVTTDLLRYATGFADQNYGNYLSRLQPIMALYGQGVQGRAGGLTNQANLATGMGTTSAELERGRGTGLASIFGTAATLPVAAGANKAQILSSIGQNIAQTTGQGMMAGQQGSANALSAIMGGLGLVGKLAAAPVTGGGSLFGNWFSGLGKTA